MTSYARRPSPNVTLSSNRERGDFWTTTSNKQLNFVQHVSVANSAQQLGEWKPVEHLTRAKERMEHLRRQRLVA